MLIEHLLAAGTAALVAFFVSAWLTHRFTNSSSWLYVLDHPNARSLHTHPTPRTGGVAILVTCYAVAAAMLVYLHAVSVEFIWLAVAGLVVGVISLVDDRMGILAIYRLGVHTVAAAMLIIGGFSLLHVEVPGLALGVQPFIGALVSGLFIVWMINLFNFMDGMDGLAGGMAVIGFGSLAIIGGLSGHVLFMAISLVIAAAAGGFLLFNFPPARIFMGDTGSSTLGFLAAVMTLWGSREGIFPLWAPILVFSPFIADASVTLIRRLWHRERVWRAHKSHYYQKLVLSGWGHRKTLLLEYTIMGVSAVTALGGIYLTGGLQIGLLVMWVIFYFVFFQWVSRQYSRFGNSEHAP